ncbi:ATP-binding protein [Clostridiaceae bacterium HSG29]|nr:ATP-binding protein [Clostridiaceae bacterium HSG29]
MKNQNINKILVNYQEKLDFKKSAIKEKKKALYRKIPRLESIDNEIKMHSLKTNKLILRNPANIEDEINKLKTFIGELKKEKAFVLTENNIPLDYLTIKYDCNLCNDTGFLKNGQRCKCLKQKIISNYYEMSNLQHKLDVENFKNFNLNIFSDKIIEGRKKSQKENIREILSKTESFATSFNSNKVKNLLFYGPTGQGKTYLCNCIANSLINKGHLVIYQTAFKLIEIIENARFNKNNFSNKDENYQMLFSSDLLIIDDLGTEFINTFTNVEIFNIINTRLNQNKKTIISTNLSPIQIKEKYSDRISSRLFGNYEMLSFYGPDLRWES